MQARKKNKHSKVVWYGNGWLLHVSRLFKANQKRFCRGLVEVKT